MADFSHLSALKVSDQTLAEYVFYEIEGKPSIWMAPATDDNEALKLERIRLLTQRVNEPGEKPVDEWTPEDHAKDFEAKRDHDRVLISKFCARRWGNTPVDVDGKAVAFGEQNCLDFLRAIPNYMFDPLRNWAANPRNFVPKAVSVEDGEKLGNASRKSTDGNSGTKETGSA